AEHKPLPRQGGQIGDRLFGHLAEILECGQACRRDLGQGLGIQKEDVEVRAVRQLPPAELAHTDDRKAGSGTAAAEAFAGLFRRKVEGRAETYFRELRQVARNGPQRRMTEKVRHSEPYLLLVFEPP